MRTTINIDNDLLAHLRRESDRSRTSFRETVNRIIKLGLERAAPRESSEPYRCPTFPMGEAAAGLNLDKALQIAAALEDEEIVRELELRK